MFKLIKIKGGRINVPEIMTCAIDGKTAYDAGCLYFLNGGTPQNAPNEEDDIKFIPIESIPKNSGKKTVCGYTVTADMVFETEIYNDHTSVKVGDSLTAHVKSNGDMDGVDAVSGSEAKLLNKDAAATDGKVLVALEW